MEEAECKVGICTFCREKKEYKRCGNCKYVRYCSKDCQIKDWPDHKNLCDLAAAHFNNPRAKYESSKYRALFEDSNGLASNSSVMEALLIYEGYCKTEDEFFEASDGAYFHIETNSPLRKDDFTIKRVNKGSRPPDQLETKIFAGIAKYDPGTVIAFYVSFRSEAKPKHYSIMNLKELRNMRGHWEKKLKLLRNQR